MHWKSWPHWVKGGILLILLVGVYSLISFSPVGRTPAINAISRVLYFPAVLTAFALPPVITGYFSTATVVIVLTAIFSGIIGAILGAFYGAVRNRPRRELPRVLRWRVWPSWLRFASVLGGIVLITSYLLWKFRFDYYFINGLFPALVDIVFLKYTVYKLVDTVDTSMFRTVIFFFFPAFFYFISSAIFSKIYTELGKHGKADWVKVGMMCVGLYVMLSVLGILHTTQYPKGFGLGGLEGFLFLLFPSLFIVGWLGWQWSSVWGIIIIVGLNICFYFLTGATMSHLYGKFKNRKQLST